MSARVAVVILNWNNPGDTLACLESLQQLTYPCFELILVDNGSDDNSVPIIRRQYPDLLLVETAANLGYAGGNNIGIRCALDRGAEFVCLLNNDTIVAPGFLEPLVAVCTDGHGAAIATPMICEEAQRDVIWALGVAVHARSAGPIRLHAGELRSAWATAAPYQVDSAAGTAMLVPRFVFESVGCLDEEFYLYFEETDWVLQAREAGFPTIAVPASVIWHKVSAALGATSPVIDYYMARNHLRFIARHWSGPARWRLLIRSVARTLLVVAAYTVKSHGGARRPHRDGRLLALRDAARGRWGQMGPDVMARIRRS